MSTYHARIITALSMLSYLEEHLGAGKAPKKAGKNQVTWPQLFTKKRVECLIACLGSNFTDVRNMAADLSVNTWMIVLLDPDYLYSADSSTLRAPCRGSRTHHQMRPYLKRLLTD